MPFFDTTTEALIAISRWAKKGCTSPLELGLHNPNVLNPPDLHLIFAALLISRMFHPNARVNLDICLIEPELPLSPWVREDCKDPDEIMKILIDKQVFDSTPVNFSTTLYPENRFRSLLVLLTRGPKNSDQLHTLLLSGMVSSLKLNIDATVSNENRRKVLTSLTEQTIEAKNIHTLDLRKNPLLPIDYILLGSLIQEKSIVSLGLSHTTMIGNNMENVRDCFISDVITNSTLKKLSLAHMSLRDEDIVWLEKILTQNRVLEEVDLSGNHFTPTGLHRIESAVTRNTLTVIGLPKKEVSIRIPEDSMTEEPVTEKPPTTSWTSWLSEKIAGKGAQPSQRSAPATESTPLLPIKPNTPSSQAGGKSLVIN